MKIAEIIDQTLENKVRKEIGKRSYFYVSEAGKRPGELFVRLIRYGYVNPRTQRIFDNGNAVHDRIINYLENKGIIKAKEVYVKNNLFHGRADAILNLDNKVAVLEIKSMNKEHFDNLKYYCDRDTYLQLQLYMHFLKINDGIILVECKDDQRLKEFHIKRKPRVAQEIMTKFYKLKEEFVQTGVMYR